jgi:hypothetical protein
MTQPAICCRSAPGRAVFLSLSVPMVAATMACGGTADAASTVWAGTADTLPSGRVVVTNPATPLWSDGEAWTFTEELRIGSFDEGGPDSFGQVIALDVDDYGRIWALESQANEIRVFDAAGTHVRTVGRKGGGPGEFGGPAHAEFGPDGNLWVPDPQNGRVSVVDTTGALVEEHRMDGGFFISPWPGGFDLEGRFYLPVPVMVDGDYTLATVMHDLDLNPLDTLPALVNPNPPERFELVSPDGESRLIATVPFSPGLTTHLAPSGTMWGMMTGEYRLFEVDLNGDTLRTIRAAYDPLPVTDVDRDAALEGLSWFTDQGGRIDGSKVPSVKPAAWNIFVDDQRRVWVNRVTDNPPGQDYDLFDGEGRFLGPVEFPAPLNSVRRVKGNNIYGVTRDDLGVPYIVRLRITR